MNNIFDYDVVRGLIGYSIITFLIAVISCCYVKIQQKRVRDGKYVVTHPDQIPYAVLGFWSLLTFSLGLALLIRFIVEGLR